MGGNVSTVKGPDASDNKSLLGFHAGVSLPLVNLSEQLGLRGELVYSQQGAKSGYGEGSYSSETKSRLNYLNLPILARYQTKSGFFAEAGLQPGLLLSAKVKRASSGMYGGGEETTDIKKDLNSFDLGVPIGAGYVFKKKIGVSARVAPGLLNVNKKDEAYTAPKQTNFVLSARVSYLF